MAWTKENPVNFTIGGDLTSEALSKHIQELEAIYGKLNRLRSLDTSNTAPTDKDTDSIWLDKASNGLKRYDGASWVDAFGMVPIGSMVMYDGAFADIPSNWALCDGTNGTLNMVDKFIYGTAIEEDIGETGGYADSVVVSHAHVGPTHTHTGPEHNHSANHNHSASSTSAGAHTHSVRGGSVDVNETADTVQEATYRSSTTMDAITSAGAHAHSITVATKTLNTGLNGVGDTGPNATGNTEATGVSGENRNIPPRIRAAYIKRIS